MKPAPSYCTGNDWWLHGSLLSVENGHKVSILFFSCVRWPLNVHIYSSTLRRTNTHTQWGGALCAAMVRTDTTHLESPAPKSLLTVSNDALFRPHPQNVGKFPSNQITTSNNLASQDFSNCKRDDPKISDASEIHRIAQSLTVCGITAALRPLRTANQMTSDRPGIQPDRELAGNCQLWVQIWPKSSKPSSERIHFSI